jgi:hypothetical protein
MRSPAANSRTGTVLLIAVAAIALAISNESFWIDEAAAASKAAQPSLEKWAEQMRAQAGSDLQMPLYMFFLWLWQKLGGSSEWYLRLGNVPWFLLGFIPFCRRNVALALLCATSSFVWFYLDEARPYAMQIGATMLLFAGGRDYLAEEPGNASLKPRMAIAAGLLILSGSSLIGMLWAGGAVVAMGIAIPFSRLRTELKNHMVLWSLTGVALAGFAGYYLWTLSAGARASGAAATDFRNVLYSAYELLGFGGLGPSRLQIRYEGFKACIGFAVPLAAYAAFALFIATAGIKITLPATPRRVAFGIAAGASVITVLVFAAGYLTHFRVLPRHLAPLVVIWFLIAAAGVEALWRSGRPARFVIIGFLMLGAIASFEQRFALRHAKDDYRGAAARVKEAIANGKHVWWTADFGGGTYYQVLPSERVTHVVNQEDDALKRLPEPQLVVMSKPELHDFNSSIRRYLHEHQYRVVETLPAFTLWSK